MKSRDFCYWLQGYFEISGKAALTENQVEIVSKHLNMVFVHEIDPSFGDAAEQDKLNSVHGGPTPNPSPGPVQRPENLIVRC